MSNTWRGSTEGGPIYEAGLPLDDANDTTKQGPIPVQIVGALVPITLSLNTGAYDADDVLADTQEVANAVPAAGGTAILDTIIVNDEDDNGTALDLLFFSANVSLGTENSAPNISDANARNFLGKVSIATGDFIDVGGVKIATLRNVGMLVKGATGSRSIYVAAITRGGTPTYTASGLRLRLGFRWG